MEQDDQSKEEEEIEGEDVSDGEDELGEEDTSDEEDILKEEDEFMENNAAENDTSKQDEEPEDDWKWWEDDDTYNELARGNKFKWRTLEHKGPVFAPRYERLPLNVRLLYNGNEVPLSEKAEEVAYAYAIILNKKNKGQNIMIDDKFKDNFFTDWKKVMTDSETRQIQDFSKCSFDQMQEHFKHVSERSEKAARDKKKEKQKENGHCTVNGYKLKIGKFMIKLPKIFTGRGNHPKRGMWMERIEPKNVVINCSEGSNVPGNWMAVKHNNSVTWLASWKIKLGSGTIGRYIHLNSSSAICGMKDFQKYEIAKKLDTCIEIIREDYMDDITSVDEDIIKLQQGVALYFIDKLLLRAGNEKTPEVADTIGCCSLRVEHLKLHTLNKIEINFIGKHSIPYSKVVPVPKHVFQKLEILMENKKDESKLFEKISTTKLNKHLNKYKITGLSVKVFRTYNASKEMEKLLFQIHSTDKNELRKDFFLSNRKVADLCNHQRADSGDNKSSTSLGYYIDPRIIVTWCNRNNVPIEEIYLPNLIKKFTWAIQKYQGVSDFLFSESNRQYIRSI